MTNSDAHNPLARFLLSRTPGILFATAALLVSFSGLAAPDLAADTATASTAPSATLPDLHDAADAAGSADTSSSEAPAEVPTLGFTTGDRLTEAQMEEFDAYIAALKTKGEHRGVAVMSSW